jgi:hypothetical protein
MILGFVLDYCLCLSPRLSLSYIYILPQEQPENKANRQCFLPHILFA